MPHDAAPRHANGEAHRAPEEIAAWEAAERPELDHTTWKQALDAAYMVLVPDDTDGLIGLDGQP